MALPLEIVLASAVAASRSLVDVERPVDPFRVPHSLCLQTGKPNEFLGGLFQREQRLFLGLVTLGGVLLVCFVLLALYMGRIPWGAPGRNLLMTLAGVLLLLALVSFLVAGMEGGWLFRRALQPQLAELKGVRDLSKPAFVRVEYPPTAASTADPVISDVAYVVCAPLHRRVIIEGVLLRHIIRAEDVLDVREVELESAAASFFELGATKTIRLQYRLAEVTELIIGLHHDSWRDHASERYLGRVRLFERVREALAPERRAGEP